MRSEPLEDAARPEDRALSVRASSAPMLRFLRFEVKVVLSPEEAALARAWADDHMARDAHGDAGRYRVDSLYLDSPTLDAYHRTEAAEGTKYRVRRYDTESVVWLERKRRRGEVVRKRRGSWPLDGLADVLGGQGTLDGWPEAFRRTTLRRRLGPKLLVSYVRTAWNGPGGARLTLDEGVEAGRLAGTASFDGGVAPRYSVGQVVVLEIKYLGRRPPLFDDLLRSLGRDATSFSKYGRGIEAAGLAIARGKVP